MIREIEGSKGRAAIAGATGAVGTAALASLGQLPESVAITLIIMVGAVAIAYILGTAYEDGRQVKDILTEKDEDEKPRPGV